MSVVVRWVVDQPQRWSNNQGSEVSRQECHLQGAQSLDYSANLYPSTEYRLGHVQRSGGIRLIAMLFYKLYLQMSL